VGTRLAVFGYSYSTGEVLMDRSLPVEGVDSSINMGFFAYMQTFGLWGRTSNLVVELPYSWGTTKGLLFENPVRRDFSGFGDLGISLAVNLIGAPSMTVAEFQELRADPPPILGASIKVIAPTGHYESDRLVNVGTNRWAVRPELGYVMPLTRKLLLELEAGAWFFGDDNDFVMGKREQSPIFAAEVHLVRRFRPGFWASLEANYFEGGRQTIGGNQLGDPQQNMRFGGTIVVPFSQGQAIKVGYSTAVLTKHGNDFDQFLVSYTVLLK
jgi:hypothetical protein